MDRKPDLVVKVYLVPHGYQVDFYQDGIQRLSTCRDFYTDKPVKFWLDLVEFYFVKALDKLREDFIK